MVGVIMKNQQDNEDEIPEVVSQMAVAVVMDPPNGSRTTFTHKLELELESEISDTENEEDVENGDLRIL